MLVVLAGTSWLMALRGALALWFGLTAFFLARVPVLVLFDAVRLLQYGFLLLDVAHPRGDGSNLRTLLRSVCQFYREIPLPDGANAEQASQGSRP
jgi:NRPS condensation-like uncharacterized protein